MITEQQRQQIKSELGYDPYNAKEILKHARRAKGKTIQELLDASPMAIKTTKSGNKGRVGNLVEENWFGIPNNSDQAPDFEEAGIELKVIPLRKKGNSWVVKEDTKITHINYKKLINENWESSHAKIKLEKILFVFYSYIKLDPLNSDSPLDLSKCKVMDIGLWELAHNNEPILRKDWYGIHKKVSDCFAHELSQSDSVALSAKTSGSGKFLEQSNCEQKAKERSFALKRAFTNQYWEEVKKHKFESLIETMGLSPQDDYEMKLLEKLHELEGKQLQEIAETYDLHFTSLAKSAVAMAIRKIIGFKSITSKIKEFEQRGLEIKTIPVRPKDNRPWEDTSFPTIKLNEFINETLEEATLLNYIERILFIPVYRNTRKAKDTPLGDLIMGKAFYWSPSKEELRIIKEEWKMYQEEILDGKAKTYIEGNREKNNLTNASRTKIIHMRPHGLKTASDRDQDHLGNSIVKQSFWLNKKFVQKLIIDSLE